MVPELGYLCVVALCRHLRVSHEGLCDALRDASYPYDVIEHVQAIVQRQGPVYKPPRQWKDAFDDDVDAEADDARSCVGGAASFARLYEYVVSDGDEQYVDSAFGFQRNGMMLG